jgi:hypothetical protein
MRKALLIASTALVVFAGCGDNTNSDQPPRNLDQDLYVICSGKPRYCAVADTREAMPEWRSTGDLSPEQADRFRRLVGPAPVPQRPG